jgi:D-sedoheptulose 7-phosphate isomerase
MDFTQKYFAQVAEIAAKLDLAAVERVADGLATVRAREGRLFVLGVGGSAANASHAVNDFRKLCDVEAYAPTDNVSELTARTNDEGWAGVFAAWLKTSRANDKDALLVLSVGGGDRERNVSPNLVEALDEAGKRGLAIYGIVGRDGGYTAKVAHAVVKIPVVDPGLVTPHSEAFQAVVWHCLVSHPKLMVNRTKW